MFDLSVIYVNYKSVDLIIDSIRSYVGSTKLNLDIIVVDNYSLDGAEEKLKSLLPFVRFVQMGYNSGFARANNAGIRNSKADTVLLLNPDTLAIEDALDRCLDRLLQSRNIAAGVQLLNSDYSPQISGNYFITGGLNNLLPLPTIGGIMKRLALLMKVKRTSLPDTNAPVEVDWINGAFLMVKTAAIDAAGLLDEDFFLYAEEIEWCSRLKTAGRIVLYGDLKFIHLQGVTANEVFDSTGKGYYNLFDKKGAQILISNFLRIRKQFGISWLLLHFAFYVAEWPLFALRMFLSAIKKQTRSTNLQLMRGYTKNLLLLARQLPSMIRNKPKFYKVL